MNNKTFLFKDKLLIFVILSLLLTICSLFLNDNITVISQGELKITTQEIHDNVNDLNAEFNKQQKMLNDIQQKLEAIHTNEINLLNDLNKLDEDLKNIKLK